MSQWRNPCLGKLFEEIADISQDNPRAANVFQTVTGILCDLDMRLAKLEDVPLDEPQPHHPK